MAWWIFSPLSVQRRTIPLRLLTAASASPLLSGLYGDDSSCVMPCAVQNSLNSDLNCGPPSVRMCVGQPKSLNHCSRCRMLAFVSNLRKATIHAYPENLSTRASHCLPVAEKRSHAVWSMGCLASPGRFTVSSFGLGLLCLCVWQEEQLATDCSISVFMLGQCFAVLYVLAIPLWPA